MNRSQAAVAVEGAVQAMAAEGTLEIPDGAVVPCRLKGDALVVVANCVSCPHFGGLVDRFPGGRQEFRVRYIHVCKGAERKQTMQIVVKG